MDLERALKGTAVVAKEIHEPDDLGDVVYIGMVWDDSGFTPASALYVDWTGSKDEAVQNADDVLMEWYMENYRDHIEEMEKEYGEGSWQEGWNGAAWEMTFREFLEAADKAGVLKELELESYL